jgi:glutathione peroxidase
MKELLGSKATLIINVASQCALTPQYEELVSLANTYSKQGFQILAFPCNQFGNQETAESSKIRKDMLKQYGVQFPILDKLDVNGINEDPLYTKLKSFKDIGVSNVARISWNFEKFLVNKEGVPVRRYKPGVLPSSVEGDLKALIVTGTVPERKKASLNDY